MKSALDNPRMIQDYLRAEIKEGRIIGPLDPKEHPYIHLSRFGVIPKSMPGKWRLIVDMSSPDGGSVNDGIRDTWCSLSCTIVTDAACGLTSYGKGALMIIVDIHNVYRVVPIHLADRWLMERGCVRRYSSAIRLAFSPQDIYSDRRCSRMDSEATGGGVRHALSRRFPGSDGSGRIQR